MKTIQLTSNYWHIKRDMQQMPVSAYNKSLVPENQLQSNSFLSRLKQILKMNV